MQVDGFDGEVDIPNSDLDQEESDNDEQDNPDPMKDTCNIEFVEDDYESVVSNLDTLIKYIDQASIHEVWRVTTIEQNKEHFLVIYGNANHLCTCMLLVTKGLVCRHFFSVMLSSEKAMFHIGLIPARWYVNEIICTFQEEAAITVCSKKDGGKSVYEHKIKIDFDMLNEIRNTQVFSETVKQNLSRQVKYNQGFGYAKRAVDLALEIGCENELNKLLQSWIKEKEKEKSESNKENLPSISNPHQTRTKGAPKKKRIKGALENTSNNKIDVPIRVDKGKRVAHITNEDLQQDM